MVIFVQDVIASMAVWGQGSKFYFAISETGFHCCALSTPIFCAGLNARGDDLLVAGSSAALQCGSASPVT